MNAVHNKALRQIAMAWKLDGDLMVCSECGRGLIASRDGEHLQHKSGCKHAARTEPWQELRLIISCEPERVPAGRSEHP